MSDQDQTQNLNQDQTATDAQDEANKEEAEADFLAGKTACNLTDGTCEACQ